MCQGVEVHLNDNASIIAANVAFVSAFNNFKTKVAAVISTTQLTDLALTGLAVTKKTSKQELCALAADIAGVVYAFADATGNATLKAEVDYSLSDLLKMKDSLVAPRCQNIYAKTVENKAALGDYGITNAMLTALQAAITGYTETIPKPRAAVSNRKTLNANIVQLFKEIDSILLNQMDKLIVTFRTANPDFVETYFNVRLITDPAVTATQLKGVVTKASDGSPVKVATVTVVELGKTAKTKSNGEYSFKPIAKGTYTVRVVKDGFKDFEADEVEVKLGDVNHLDAELAT
jgi:hypothetical protein